MDLPVTRALRGELTGQAMTSDWELCSRYILFERLCLEPSCLNYVFWVVFFVVVLGFFVFVILKQFHVSQAGLKLARNQG